MAKRQYAPGWAPLRDTPEHKRAESFINRQTGEILPRRQYDKQYGILKEQGFKSYTEKREVRRAAGFTQRDRGIDVRGTHKYDRTNRRHIYVVTSVKQLEKTSKRLLKSKGFKASTVSVRVETKKGWRQSVGFDPRDSNIGASLAAAAAALESLYGEDDDDIPDPYDEPEDWQDYELEMLWAENG